jgi:trigger factor
MNVSLRNIDSLNAILTVEIQHSDYADKVETALNNYRKRATLPGFRQGKAPVGLIRKQYLKPLTIDEVNKLMQDAVYEYLTNEKLDILGNPLPVEQTNIDWDKQTDFNFEFELGLTPQIDVTIPSHATLTYMKVVADDEMLNGYFDDLCRRYGKMSVPETPAAGDMFLGEFTEVDEAGNPVEDGITKKATITGTSVADEATLNALLNLKNGENTTINFRSAFREDFNAAGLLGVTSSKLEESTGLFRFALESVSRLEPHELNQELFDRVLGEGAVNGEAEFRARMKKEAEKTFVGQSDSDFYHHAYHWFLDNVKFDLPETFLKKWLRVAGERPLTAEQVEAEFPSALSGLRWQLIENRLIRNNNLQVTEQELMDYTKGLVRDQFAQYGQMMNDEQVESFAKTYLQKREQAEQLNDQVYNKKLIQFFKESFAIEYKEVSAADFARHQSEHQH